MVLHKKRSFKIGVYVVIVLASGSNPNYHFIDLPLFRQREDVSLCFRIMANATTTRSKSSSHSNLFPRYTVASYQYNKESVYAKHVDIIIDRFFPYQNADVNDSLESETERKRERLIQTRQ